MPFSDSSICCLFLTSKVMAFTSGPTDLASFSADSSVRQPKVTLTPFLTRISPTGRETYPAPAMRTDLVELADYFEKCFWTEVVSQSRDVLVAETHDNCD